MEGRKENDRKIEKKIEDLLNHAPSYMKNYYYTLEEKSYTTRFVYINYVLDFINYVDRNFILDVKDANCFSDITTSDINAYILTLDGKNSIKASRIYGIKSFFKYLLNNGYISSNPCNGVDVPIDKEEHKVVSLTKEDIDIIKNNILSGCGNDLAKKRQKEWRNRDYAIIMVGLSLGLRVTSLSEINVDDIDFDNMEIKVAEKGNKTRYIPFGEKLKDVIERWLEDREVKMLRSGKNSDALFISKQMKRITPRAIGCIVKKYTYNIDKHISPHKLRSTCAINVYNTTGDLYLASYMLGHSNTETTKRYIKMSEEKKKQAANAMDDILF